MNEKTKKSAPNVEEIMKDISDRIDQAVASSSASESDAIADNNLYESLRLANENYAVPPPAEKGLRAFLNRVMYSLLSGTFRSIESYHIHSLRVLNKMTKLIDGSSDEISGEILTKTKNRMDLIEAVSDRVAELEKRLDKLDKTTGETKDSVRSRTTAKKR